MNIEKMTTTLQEAIAEAQQIAVTRKHQDIDIAHVWKIFLQPNHFGRNFYTDAGLDVESFEYKIHRLLDEYPVVSGGKCPIWTKPQPEFLSIYRMKQTKYVKASATSFFQRKSLF